MALASAVWESCASLRASAFSSLPVARMSVASSMKEVMSAIIFCASAISPVRVWYLVFPLLILPSSSSSLSVLSSMDASVLLTSLSHHSLCSSSCVCSSISLKIIFSIWLLTSPKASFLWRLKRCAKRASTCEWVLRAASRRRFRAFSRGSTETWRKEAAASRGEGPAVGLLGASCLTLAALARIFFATSIASSSCARTSVRSSHSCAFMEHSLWVVSRLPESAVRSSCVLFRSALLSIRPCCTSERMRFFSFLESCAAAIALSRAFLASS
mmetsp:Transcript_68377/g.200717  ORF Transcript_68377/g.200717 Transcript_68377/m.200717 type:complete len:271 (+) Transcript_68377:208-1020(+)